MNTNKRIVLSLIAISVLFFSLIVYLTYFEVFTKDQIVSNNYNQRLSQYEDAVLRGNIYDRNGRVIAYSQREGEEAEQKRIYPYDNMYSHVIGYSSKTYGKALLEASYNKYLLNINELRPVIDLKNQITGQTSKGNNLYLTIDHELQSLGQELLDGSKGAIVAMDPKTGEVLAMVSKPDYNPNSLSLEKNWTSIVESENTPLLPRATQGLYQPGSTFKTLVASQAIEEGLGDTIFEDKGTTTISGKEIKNYGVKAYGSINLEEALTYSSNVAFAELGLALGDGGLRQLSEKLLFNQSINFEISIKKSSFPTKKLNKSEQAVTAYGQGELLVTPMHMAMMVSSIANDGLMMKPILVKNITGFTGTEGKPEELSRVMSPETAHEVSAMMESVVNKGTGKNAAISGIQVAGKTGTAENNTDKSHAWFIGFAPADDPQIAVAVILENSGSTGGQAAAPLARWIIQQGLK